MSKHNAILIAPLGALVLAGFLIPIQVAHADISPGALAARNDWAAGTGRDDSCNDHGYNSAL
jgi:hypothetical protein